MALHTMRWGDGDVHTVDAGVLWNGKDCAEDVIHRIRLKTTCLTVQHVVGHLFHAGEEGALPRAWDVIADSDQMHRVGLIALPPQTATQLLEELTMCSKPLDEGDEVRLREAPVSTGIVQLLVADMTDQHCFAEHCPCLLIWLKGRH